MQPPSSLFQTTPSTPRHSRAYSPNNTLSTTFLDTSDLHFYTSPIRTLMTTTLTECWIAWLGGGFALGLEGFGSRQSGVVVLRELDMVWEDRRSMVLALNQAYRVELEVSTVRFSYPEILP
ncbi:hypothetical protein NX059_005780 [Plenodomus lindquistii]|nr:hypothetical protein NX059_005780 [Plenodomus lindquistii]